MPTMDYSLYAKELKKWAPNTTYQANQQVIAPSNEVVSAKTSHLSGTTFTAANWNIRTATTAAIASPTAPGAAYVQAEATSAKTAIDSIRAALIAAGITL